MTNSQALQGYADLILEVSMQQLREFLVKSSVITSFIVLGLTVGLQKNGLKQTDGTSVSEHRSKYNCVPLNVSSLHNVHHPNIMYFSFSMP